MGPVRALDLRANINTMPDETLKAAARLLGYRTGQERELVIAPPWPLPKGWTYTATVDFEKGIVTLNLHEENGPAER
jgi:hypothetical protein